MKKFLSLMMVVALVLVCAACASTPKKDSAQSVTCKYTVYNRTGGDVTNLTLTSNKDGIKIEVNSVIENGSSHEITIAATLDDAGVPDITIAFTNADGTLYSTALNEKESDITLLAESGDNSVFDFQAPKD